jgi:hypothetical protein
MSKLKKLSTLIDEVDFDLQLIASEFDTTLKLLFFVEVDMSNNANFDFIMDLKRNYFEMSYNENIDFYKIEKCKIILIENLFSTIIVFENKNINFIKKILQL